MSDVTLNAVIIGASPMRWTVVCGNSTLWHFWSLRYCHHDDSS
jgi:hypothetical protein